MADNSLLAANELARRQFVSNCASVGWSAKRYGDAVERPNNWLSRFVATRTKHDFVCIMPFDKYRCFLWQQCEENDIRMGVVHHEVNSTCLISCLDHCCEPIKSLIRAFIEHCLGHIEMTDCISTADEEYFPQQRFIVTSRPFVGEIFSRLFIWVPYLSVAAEHGVRTAAKVREEPAYSILYRNGRRRDSSSAPFLYGPSGIQVVPGGIMKREFEQYVRGAALLHLEFQGDTPDGCVVVLKSANVRSTGTTVQFGPQELATLNLTGIVVVLCFDGVHEEPIELEWTLAAWQCNASSVVVLRKPNRGQLHSFYENLGKRKRVSESAEQISSCRLIGLETHAAPIDLQAFSIGKPLRELLNAEDDCRQALRVLLHLSEKSLQRLRQEDTEALYTSESSIRSKVGPEAVGWRELLLVIGFQFVNSATQNSASVYFPQASHCHILERASKTLQALLGLPPSCVAALKLIQPYFAADVLSLLEHLSVGMETATDSFEMSAPSESYELGGVRGLLSSMGFDKLSSYAGKEGQEVRLRTIRIQLTKQWLATASAGFLGLFDDCLPRRRIDGSWTKAAKSINGGGPKVEQLFQQAQRATVGMELSGFESDFSCAMMLCSGSVGAESDGETAARAPSKRRRKLLLAGKKCPDADGYASESELKLSSRNSPKGSRPGNLLPTRKYQEACRGYQSEGDSPRRRRLVCPDSSSSILDCTAKVCQGAKVLGVDEEEENQSDGVLEAVIEVEPAEPCSISRSAPAHHSLVPHVLQPPADQEPPSVDADSLRFAAAKLFQHSGWYKRSMSPVFSDV